MRSVMRITALLLLVAGFSLSSCAKKNLMEDLPKNPVARAAVVALLHSYRESTMWEIRKAKSLAIQPMVPTRAFVQEHDPKELYCVCVEYEARYKVPWSTEDGGKWESGVHNILVMKAQSDEYLALKYYGICPAYCR